jgi:3-oxoacyl-[acyl-carrier-protein] synthase-3
LPSVEARPERPAAGVAIAAPEISGLGACLPGEAIDNAAVGALAGVDAAWIERRTGIRSRRRAHAQLTLADLAARAGADALADAGLEAAQLDLVLVATISQERPIPNVAPQVAHALGAGCAAAFDLGAACTGFVLGLATAGAFIECGRARHVLVIAADLLSRQTDTSDRRTAALFGDGAAAAVVNARGTGRGWSFELGSDGSAAGLIESDPVTGLIRMQGHETFIQAVQRMEQATRAACARADVGLEEIDLFVFHQANARITRTLGERLAIDRARVVDCIAELGNTSAASVPLALVHARSQGALRAGDRVLLCAAGAGFTWGAAVIDWSSA